MSKAEEKAEVLYPILETDKIGNNPYISHNVEQLAKREGYVEGYHQAEKDLTDQARLSSGWDGFYYGQGYKQAEKDLELTWEDVFNIFHLVNEVLDDYAEGRTKKEVGKEVLKRFNEERQK